MYKVVEYRHYTSDNTTRMVYYKTKEDTNTYLMFHQDMQNKGTYRFTRKRTNNIVVVNIYFTDC